MKAAFNRPVWKKELSNVDGKVTAYVLKCGEYLLTVFRYKSVKGKWQTYLCSALLETLELDSSVLADAKRQAMAIMRDK